MIEKTKKYVVDYIKKLRNISLYDSVLFISFFVSFIAVVYSILTYGRTVINSDTATLTNFVNCVLKEKSLFPKSWNYVNGEIWTLNMLPISIGQAIFGFVSSESLRRMLASAFQIVIGELCIVLFFKRVLKNNSWMIVCSLCTLFIWGSGEFMLYQAPYSVFLIWWPIFIWLGFSIYQFELSKGNVKKYLILAIMIMYACMQGIRAYAEYVIPLICAEWVMLYFYEEYSAEKRKKCILSSVMIIVPAIMGTIIYKWLCTWHNVNNTKGGSLTLPETLKAFSLGAKKTFTYFFECFGYEGGNSVFSLHGMRDLISIIVCILICVIIPILQLFKLKYEDKINVYVYTLIMIHNIEMCIFTTCFNFTLYYHILSSVILTIFISARYIYVYWIKGSKGHIGRILAFLFLIAAVIESCALFEQSEGWKDKLAQREKISQELLKHDLHKGYANFWAAYSNEIYSNGNIKIAGVKIYPERLREYTWLVDNDRYIEENQKTFIMLTDSEYSNVSERILYGYDGPIEEFTIENVPYTSDSEGDIVTDMHVLVYGDDYVRHIINNLDDGFLDPREMFFNHIGVRDEQTIVMSKDGMVFGPYADIEKGTYRVTINGTNLYNSTVEVKSDDRPDDVKYKILALKETECLIELEIINRVEDIQFVICNEGIKNEEAVILLGINVSPEE